MPYYNRDMSLTDVHVGRLFCGAFNKMLLWRLQAGSTAVEFAERFMFEGSGFQGFGFSVFKISKAQVQTCGLRD